MGSPEDRGSGLFALYEAAQRIGDITEPQPEERIRRNADKEHEYARCVPERGTKNKKETKKDYRIRLEPKERHRPGGRLEHNRLEKDRRAQLKVNFNILKEEIPSLKDKKASNQAILKAGHKHIQSLQQQGRRVEAELQKQSQEKIKLKEKLEAAIRRYEERTGMIGAKCLEEIDDAASDSTDTAEGDWENGKNYQDQLDEHDLEMVRRWKEPTSVPRGIPHPVITQVPQAVVRQAVSESLVQVQPVPREMAVIQVSAPPVQGHSAATQETVAKLAAKLKQGPNQQQTNGAVQAAPVPRPQPQVVMVSRPPHHPATVISTTNIVNTTTTTNTRMLPQRVMSVSMAGLPGGSPLNLQSLLPSPVTYVQQPSSTHQNPVLRGGSAGGVVSVSNGSVVSVSNTTSLLVSNSQHPLSTSLLPIPTIINTSVNNNIPDTTTINNPTIININNNNNMNNNATIRAAVSSTARAPFQAPQPLQVRYRQSYDIPAASQPMSNRQVSSMIPTPPISPGPVSQLAPAPSSSQRMPMVMSQSVLGSRQVYLMAQSTSNGLQVQQQSSDAAYKPAVTLQ